MNIKNAIGGGMLAAALTLAAGSALAAPAEAPAGAEPGHGHMWHEPGPGMHGGGAEAGFMHVLHELKLSDAQHQQVKAILEQARAERQAAAPPAAADQLALADPGDPNHAAAVATAKLRAADHIQHLSDVQQQLYAVLTPAQQAQLPTLLAAQQKHWAEHWAGHGEPRQ